MKYEGVSFNSEWVARFATDRDFVTYGSWKHLWPDATRQVRDERLREVYKLSKQLHGKND